MAIKIAIDTAGGDYGSEVTVQAAVHALQSLPDLKIYLVGDKNLIEQQLKKHNVNANIKKLLVIVHTAEVITMEDDLATAIRQKKRSSMRLAIDLVKDGKANACVSAGNTGALMAISRLVLKTIKGIDRPAIMARIPNTNDGYINMLDLGANVDSKPETLLGFATMGSVVVQHTKNIKKPKRTLSRQILLAHLQQYSQNIAFS